MFHPAGPQLKFAESWLLPQDMLLRGGLEKAQGPSFLTTFLNHTHRPTHTQPILMQMVSVIGQVQMSSKCQISREPCPLS